MNFDSSPLSCYFCKICTVSDLILNQTSCEVVVPDTLKLLLKQLFLATDHSYNFMPENFTLQKCCFTYEEILHRSIERLLDSKRSNVLSLGFTLMREGYNRVLLAGSNRVQVKAPNTTVMYLKTKALSGLHAVLGDSVLMHILQNLSMFIAVKNGCLVQLCGTPLHERTMLSNCSLTKHPQLLIQQKREMNASKKRPLSEHSQLAVSKRRKLTKTPKDDIKQKQKTNSIQNYKFHRYRKSKVDKQQKSRTKHKKVTSSKGRNSKPEYLARSKIFYSKSYFERFNQKHPLSNVKSSNAGAYEVLNSIYSFATTATTQKPAGKIHRLPKHLIGVKNLFKTVIANFKKLKLTSLLKFYCPSPRWLGGVRKGFGRKVNFWSKIHYRFLVKSYTPVEKVYLFVRKVLTKVFPPLLWGCNENKKTLFSAMMKFLTMGRYERFTIRNAMNRIKISRFSCFDWKQPKQGSSSGSSHKKNNNAQYSLKKEQCVCTLIRWIFNMFIVPLLSACFYITETSGVHKNKTLYYRKPVWRVLSRLGMQPLLGNLFTPLSKASVNDAFAKEKCIGVHAIRLLPAQKKMRPISVFTKSHTDSKKNFSINNELRSLHLALQYESSLSPQVLGVTVSTQDQIYEKWRDFAVNCKSTPDGCIPKLYALSLDIKRCFDTLPQDRILRLTEDILKEDSYVIKKFVKIKKIHDFFTRNKFVSIATNGFDCTNFVAFIRKEMESGRIVGRNVVFVDKVFYRAESRDQLLAMATKHIKHSVGYNGDRYFLQSTGIAQGSILSTTLNNLHYGNIEQKYLMSNYKTSKSLFVRWVDDYLFVTTQLQLAQRFLNTMRFNMPLYGSDLNVDKVLINFEVTDQTFGQIHGQRLSWCGFLFNLETMECSYNYIQYVGESIRDRMTSQYGSHPGVSMAKQMILSVTAKASLLIVDGQFNSLLNVHKNVYQVFRFAALKFLVHAKMLRKEQHINFSFCFQVIKKLPHKFFKRIHNYSKNIRTAHVSYETHPTNHSIERGITLQTSQVLCYQAFLDELKPRQTLFKPLIRMIVKELRLMKQLTTGIDFNGIRKRSEHFKMIKL